MKKLIDVVDQKVAKNIKFNTLNMKVNKLDPLAVEKNNYLTKNVKVYIVYDRDALPKIPLRRFTLKD